MFRRGSVSWIQFRKDGQRVRESLRTENKKLAEELRRRRSAEMEAERFGLVRAPAAAAVAVAESEPAPPPATLESVRADYAAWSSAHKRPKTIRNDTARLAVFFATVPGKRLRELTTADVERQLTREALKGRKPATLLRHREILHAFWRWAERQGSVDKNVVASIPRPRLPEHDPRFLSLDQVDELLAKMGPSALRLLCYRGREMATRPAANRHGLRPPPFSTAEGSMPWHSMTAAEVLARQGSAAHGLTSSEAERRLVEFGPNQLNPARGPSFLEVLLGQFRSFIVWLLIAAAAVSGVLGDAVDAFAIATILVLNGLIGAWQEFRAERSIAALKRMTAPQAKVRRGGTTWVVPSAEVVPGDILLLESGDLVAADARLVEATMLACIEKSLTGESEPAAKDASTQVEPTATLADRSTMIYMGTSIATGTARAVVTATGMRTEVGRIAGLIEAAGEGEETPLQARLRRVGHVLVFASLVVVAGLFAIGLARGEPLLQLLLIAVSLAVAAVPEGLPAIVTVALAIGVRRMAQRKALIRRLPAVETLGSTNVICTDKTGTLTVGQMTVRAACIAGRGYQFQGEGYAPKGEVLQDGQPVPATARTALRLLARNLAGGTNAEVVLRDGNHEAIGDPTEAAMVVAAAKIGLAREDMDQRAPKLGEVPFDSDRRRVCVVRHASDATVEVLVNGAPESVLALCTHRLGEQGVVAMSEEDRAGLLEWNTSLARQALRVLACARAERSGAAAAIARTMPTAEALERDLTFVGLIGMYDPPRSEARDAIRRCAAAGIRVVMITGDQPRTAQAIAHELGLAVDGSAVLAGAELQRMDDATLVARIADTAVFARVTAADKLRIVRAWQVRGAVVAMTGDGVNDAPALRGADVGVAMGRAGTEVAKQAADMVVTDDNFASLVAAVEEGRGVYDNIRKTLLFLLGGNGGELLLMTVCLVAGLPSPLLPIQILWINLVTDGLPALFLAADPVAPDVMLRKPRARGASIVDRSFLGTAIWTAALTAGVAIGVYLYGLSYEDERTARTHAFAALVFAELLRSFGCRSETVPLWRLSWRTNRMLVLVVAASCLLQIWSHHNETLSGLMGTSTLGWIECLSIFLIACIPAGVLEFIRWLRNRRPAQVGRT